MSRTVTSQDELNAALAAKTDVIYIDSPDGVWLTLEDRDSSHVEARGSSRVEARGSSRVVAWDSSHVVAWDSSRVVAWDSSHVEARDSSHVEARDSSHVEAWDSSHVEAWGSSHVVARDSSHVEARDSSHVEAWDSSHVEARDSSRVEARDSSHVVAWGSSHVVARDSSHVVARDSSHVVAWGSSHVEAGSYVAVHLHSQRVELTGGVLIDMTAIDRKDPAVWADLHGVKVTDGHVVLFKATDAKLTAGQQYRPVTYTIGETVACADWRDDNQCGGGLHLSPSPSAARAYRPDAERYVACRVALADLRPIPGGTPKCKVRQVEVLHEVDLYGKQLAAVPS